MALGAVRITGFLRGVAGLSRQEYCEEPRHEPGLLEPGVRIDRAPRAAEPAPNMRAPKVPFPIEADNGEMIPIAEFLLKARQIGITDRRILAAIESVPRPIFLDGDARFGPLYAERPQPIACGQLTTPPLVIARLLMALGAGEGDRVLEIGTGTGYLSAVLSRLSRRVYTLDRFRTLVTAAQSRLASLRIENVTSIFADGTAGWPDKSPFDRIVATASAPSVPPAFVEQLSTTGVLIMPIGPADGIQRLTRFERIDRQLVATPICDVRLLPFIAGKAQRL
jgi:protein-L-isoaspartate(D-aspartate) O-methyltransferase